MSFENQGVIPLDDATKARIIELETEAYRLYTTMFCQAFVAALRHLEAVEPATASRSYLRSPKPGFHPGYIIRQAIETWAPTHPGNHYLSDWYHQELRRMIADGLIEETTPLPGNRTDEYYRLIT